MTTKSRNEQWAGADPAKLLQALELHQAELESQNHELQSANAALRRTNDALAISDARFRTLFERAPTPYVSIDASRAILGVNAAGVEILGAPRERLLGATMELFVRDADRARFRTFLEGVFVADHTRCADLVLARADGTSVEVQIDGVILPDADAESRCVLAIVDVTARKLAEAARRKAQDEVLAIVSHDLRGPLNAIGLACDALASGLTPDEHHACLSAIGRAAARAERLIKDLLGVAHIESGRLTLQLRNFDVRELARQVCRDLEPAATAVRSSITVAVPEEPALIDGDHDRLHQVMSNLIGNALVHARGSAIDVSVVSRGHQVVIVVADHGPGISAEELPIVFERYRQGARHHGGAGLGLAIVKGLVEAHHGTAVVTSRLGQGARFEICLPRSSVGDSARSGAGAHGG